MRFRRAFTVRAEMDAVNKFHTRSTSMAAITPPPIIVQLHHAPPILQNGDQMDFTLWLGPLPIRWTAQIERMSASGFIDRQIRGSFEAWEHTHIFSKIDDRTTEILDQVDARLKKHPFWWLVGALMWIGLPLLFAYRGWKTRKLLQGAVQDRKPVAYDEADITAPD